MLVTMLAAKGYHYRYVLSLDTGHCEGVFDLTLAEALSWRGVAMYSRSHA